MDTTKLTDADKAKLAAATAARTTTNNAGHDKRTPCPITREHFMGAAVALSVTLPQGDMLATPRSFSTGSFGWYAGGKQQVKVDGKWVTVQVGITMTVVGSKDAE
jgi:hypothetical protein